MIYEQLGRTGHWSQARAAVRAERMFAPIGKNPGTPDAVRITDLPLVGWNADLTAKQIDALLSGNDGEVIAVGLPYEEVQLLGGPRGGERITVLDKAPYFYVRISDSGKSIDASIFLQDEEAPQIVEIAKYRRTHVRNVFGLVVYDYVGGG